MDINNKLLLKEKEAAELLSMSTHFLRRDRITNSCTQIPFIRIGGSVRYSLVELENWIASQAKRTISNEPLAQLEQLAQLEIVAPVKRGRGRPRKADQIQFRMKTKFTG